MAEIGSMIGRYAILERLGEGGMGVVYKAQDTTLDRLVALKFLSPHLAATESEILRFTNEAKAAAALNHPHICTIYGIHEHEGQQFIEMEYVDGTTLAGKIASGQLSVDSAIGYAVQVAEALHEAHSKGIIHRDIKPANIMVGHGDRIKIMDFGLARMKSGQSRYTRTGMVAGTPMYMSPEQIQGLEVDHRTDIFSLGAVMYETLTGRPPFSAEYEAAISYAVVNMDPPPIVAMNAAVPADLEKIIFRSLAKKPDSRYQTCNALVRDLHYRGSVTLPALHDTEPRQVETEDDPQRVFVSRTPELATMQRLLDSITPGKGTTLFVRGESGIGKSRLAREAARLARARGARVLQGRCLFREPGVPYHPFVTAMKSGTQMEAAALVDWFSRAATAQGITLGGRLTQLRSFFNLADQPAGLVNKEQLWDSILIALRLLAVERPVLLVVDDLQWSDKTTLGLFMFLARNISDIPLLLIGIYRPGEWTQEQELDINRLMEPIRQLLIEHLAEEISLGRLSGEDTAMLVSDMLEHRELDPEVLRTAYDISRGNPLFTIELITLMKADGSIAFDGTRWKLVRSFSSSNVPNRLRDIVFQRLGQLSDAERQLLEVASCEGDHFQSDVLSVVLHIGKIDVLRQLQSLEKIHHLVRHDARRYLFDHPLIRQVVYDEMLDELREEYHRILANWLMEHHGGDDEQAARIAHHLKTSHRADEAVPYLLTAADRAKDLYAIDEALQLYREAFDILEGQHMPDHATTCAVREGLGEACLILGNTSDALAHFSPLLELVRTAGDRPFELRVLRKLGEVFRILGNTSEAIRVLDKALGLGRELDLPGEQVECLNTLGFTYSNRLGDYPRAIAIFTEALRLAEEIHDERNIAASLGRLGLTHWHQGEYRKSVWYYEQAVQLQRSIGDIPGLATTMNFMGLACHRLGEFDRALSFHLEALRIKKSITDNRAIPGTLNNIGELYRDLGNPEKALEYHSQSLALAREQQNPGATCDNLRDLAADYLLAGDLDRALHAIEEVLALSQRHGLTWYETRSYITLGDVHLARGEPEPAERYSRLGVHHAFDLNANELKIEAMRGRAAVLSRFQRDAEAGQLLRQAIEIAEKVEHRIFHWQMYRELAACEFRLNKLEEARESDRRARDLLEESIATIQDTTLREMFVHSPAVRAARASMNTPDPYSAP